MTVSSHFGLGGPSPISIWQFSSVRACRTGHLPKGNLAFQQIHQGRFQYHCSPFTSYSSKEMKYKATGVGGLGEQSRDVIEFWKELSILEWSNILATVWNSSTSSSLIIWINPNSSSTHWNNSTTNLQENQGNARQSNTPQTGNLGIHQNAASFVTMREEASLFPMDTEFNVIIPLMHVKEPFHLRVES